MIKFQLFLFALFFYLTACNSNTEVPIENITRQPAITNADQQYAGVFYPLNGTWEGVFMIYEDSLGQAEGISQPRDLSGLDSYDLSLRLVQSINVRQEYVSESPYFQRVTIRDTYMDENNGKHVVVSKGVNKVQEGKLWCVVKKPEETIIHRGELEGESTIIWQRELRNPLKIEYFRETVENDFYKIIGWGYYGNDNPSLSPRIWYVGDYNKIEEGSGVTSR